MVHWILVGAGVLVVVLTLMDEVSESRAFILLLLLVLLAILLPGLRDPRKPS